jgi:hypothetical protein
MASHSAGGTRSLASCRSRPGPASSRWHSVSSSTSPWRSSRRVGRRYLRRTSGGWGRTRTSRQRRQIASGRRVSLDDVFAEIAGRDCGLRLAVDELGLGPKFDEQLALACRRLGHDFERFGMAVGSSRTPKAATAPSCGKVIFRAEVDCCGRYLGPLAPEEARVAAHRCSSCLPHSNEERKTRSPTSVELRVFDFVAGARFELAAFGL